MSQAAPTPDAVRWQRIESLLHRALECDAVSRARLIARECGDDESLRREVESLVAASEAADPAAIHITGPARQGMEEPLASGTRIGAWQVQALVGRGGMGEVYRAARADGSHAQTVALKVLRREAAEHLERFHAERRILARLQHPGIARLVDAGVTADGRPAMMMEFVEGVPLLEHCAARGLPLAERLALFRQVCAAVADAHAHLVIHRDLKPGNVLVTAEGQVKLLDFGVAKLLDPAAFGSRTETRLAPLTPSHAAPEQLRGEAITTATDVYALGVILFELLAGRTPFPLGNAPLSVALHRLLTEEAPRASEVAATAHARLLRGDLDAIAAKALRKDARERYATVAALLADLDHHAVGEPVAARRGGEWYRIGKFMRRHRLALAVACGVLLLTAGFVWRLAIERHRALAISAFLRDDLLGAADPFNAAGGTSDAPALLRRAAERLPQRLGDEPRVRAEVALTLARAWRGQAAYAEGIRAVAPLLADAEATLGPAHDTALALRLELAELHRLAGQLDQAEALHREGLRHAAPRGTPAFGFRAGLAALAFERGQQAAALKDYETLLAEAEQRDDVDELQHADLRWHLTALDLDRGELVRAEANARALVAFHTARFGPTHANTRWMRTTLGQVLLVQQRAAEAADIFRAVRDEAEAELGPDHPNTTSAAYLFARALIAQGRSSEALPLLRDTLARRSRVHGEAHAWTVLVRHRLGEALSAASAHTEALTLLRQVVAESTTLYGAEAPNTLDTAITHARALAASGNAAAARALLDERSAAIEASGDAPLAARWQAARKATP